MNLSYYFRLIPENTLKQTLKNLYDRLVLKQNNHTSYIDGLNVKVKDIYSVDYFLKSTIM